MDRMCEVRLEPIFGTFLVKKKEADKHGSLKNSQVLPCELDTLIDWLIG